MTKYVIYIWVDALDAHFPRSMFRLIFAWCSKIWILQARTADLSKTHIFMCGPTHLSDWYPIWMLPAGLCRDKCQSVNVWPTTAREAWRGDALFRHPILLNADSATISFGWLWHAHASMLDVGCWRRPLSSDFPFEWSASMSRSSQQFQTCQLQVHRLHHTCGISMRPVVAVITPIKKFSYIIQWLRVHVVTSVTTSTDSALDLSYWWLLLLINIMTRVQNPAAVDVLRHAWEIVDRWSDLSVDLTRHWRPTSPSRSPLALPRLWARDSAVPTLPQPPIELHTPHRLVRDKLHLYIPTWLPQHVLCVSTCKMISVCLHPRCAWQEDWLACPR